MTEFKGRKFIEGTQTWTPEYDQWRRDNHLCNSPMAWVLMKRQERDLKLLLQRRVPRLVKFLTRRSGV